MPIVLLERSLYSVPKEEWGAVHCLLESSARASVAALFLGFDAVMSLEP